MSAVAPESASIAISGIIPFICIAHAVVRHHTTHNAASGNNSTVPGGFQDELHGFDILTDDAPGLIAELTTLMAKFGILIIGHTGERLVLPGPRVQIKAGQKFVVMLPHRFDSVAFNRALSELVRKHNGTMKTPLRMVPGLLWSW